MLSHRHSISLIKNDVKKILNLSNIAFPKPCKYIKNQKLRKFWLTNYIAYSLNKQFKNFIPDSSLKEVKLISICTLTSPQPFTKSLKSSAVKSSNEFFGSTSSRPFLIAQRISKITLYYYQFFNFHVMFIVVKAQYLILAASENTRSHFKPERKTLSSTF